MMTQSTVSGLHYSTTRRGSPMRSRARLAQRAVSAAHCLLAFRQYSVRPVAAAFQVSIRSVRRGQLLLEEGNPELLANTLLGRTSLTEAAVIIGAVQTMCAAQIVQQADSRLSRVIVTLRLPLGARATVLSGASK